ncbi:hypothetical protein QAD02_018614 [Eretmocerus hayati]|uniref:Uncharacterized protein n=1 Tax=Eretmocerus hayati TaxID=131215 RepID=A0ACC2PHI3_9HYME|nr:hypothetical protein QAD02_018614 [Eretmocerus hayati]
MFRFNFNDESNGNEEKSNIEEDKEKDDKLEWFSAKRISKPLEDYNVSNITNDQTTNVCYCDVKIKLVDSKTAFNKLAKENCQNIIEAESQHSDLLPAKYEGGLKIWECTHDLARYLLEENILLKDKTVLDLGCGAGVLGLVALLQGSNVHFQDYNLEVIESYTIPNVILNCDKLDTVTKRCQFYCGDWESFVNLIGNDESEEYDYILSSETIYNPNNYPKLYQIFKQKLRKNGICYIAAKIHYFGVGGSIQQFEEFITKDGLFNIKTVWKSDEGLQREVLEVKRR